VQAYERAGILSAAKHFPGLGAAAQSTAEGPATVGLSLEELEDRDLLPFRAAFRARVPAVVLSSALYAPDDFLTPGSLSKAVVTDLLRRDLGFRGLAITDDLADPGVSANVSAPAAAVRALKAGADMVQLSGAPTDQQRAYEAVLGAVRRGQISRARLDEAAARVLTAKRRIRLLR